MKILVIGDPHFKTNNVLITSKMCERTLDYLKNNQIDFIVILGDTLDRHESIHMDPLSDACQFILNISEFAKTYVLIGNHDRKNNKDFLSEKHPFKAFERDPKVTIVHKTLLEKIGEQIFTFVPYVPNGKFEEALETLHNEDWKKSRLIFAHQEFFGVIMGLIQSDHGDRWPDSYPYVISGHIHEYSQLQPNILYTGTPYQGDFGDISKKSIWLITVPLDSKEEINQERIYLDLPQKITVSISFAEYETYNLPEEENKYRIEIEGTIGEIKSLNSDKKLKQWIKDGHKVNFRYKKSTHVDHKKENFEPRKFQNNYLQLLQKSVEKDERLKEAYRDCFQ